LKRSRDTTDSGFARIIRYLERANILHDTKRRSSRRAGCAKRYVRTMSSGGIDFTVASGVLLALYRTARGNDDKFA